MIHSASQVLRQVLCDIGVATFPPEIAVEGTWPTYDDGMPSSPDSVVAVEGVEGYNDGASMHGDLFYHYGVQIKVRSRDKREGHDKLERIRLLLPTVYQRTVFVEGSKYTVHCVAKIGEVLSLGKDVSNSKRSMFSLNAAMPFLLVSEATFLKFEDGMTGITFEDGITLMVEG